MEIAMFKYFLSNQRIFKRVCYNIVLIYVTLVIHFSDSFEYKILLLCKMNTMSFFSFIFEKKIEFTQIINLTLNMKFMVKNLKFFGNFILFLQKANFTFIKNFVKQNCRLIHEQQIHNVTEEFFF